MILLDSTACIDFLKGNKNILEILHDFDTLFFITTVTIYEVEIGLERIKIKGSKKKYEDLFNIWEKFILNMQILNFTLDDAKKAAEIYIDLESKGQIINDNDILIAAIMLNNGIYKIITRNVKHFEKIEHIKIISY